MYQTNFNAQPTQGQSGHLHLDEQDVANLVLSELKRAAREYTTAALESAHPAIRQTFATLTQKTLQDQAELFTILSQIGGYSNIKLASSQEVQQELQQRGRKAEQLQAVVQQAVQHSYASLNAGQQNQGFAQQQQMQAHPAFQSHQPFQPAFGAGSSGYGNQGGHFTSQTSGLASGTNYGQSQGAQQGFGAFSSTLSTDSDFNMKSAAAPSDNQDYYAAKSVQDYSSNKYSSSAQDAYGSKTQQEQETSYTSSAGRTIGGGYQLGATSSATDISSSGSHTSSSALTAGSKHQSTASGSSHGTKYMM